MSVAGINLLQQKQPQAADKLLYFILHYFRYIIVLTQIVVISVFFYRFQEDQKIIDQKESFKQKQHILLITLPVIEEAEAIELKTDHINELLNTQNKTLNHLSFLSSVIPEDITVQKIQVTDATMQVIGSSKNLLSIRSLHKRIKQIKQYELAKITSIQQDSFGGYTFGIGVVLVP
jgi:Tfp pilus assembly protein PilN